MRSDRRRRRRHLVGPPWEVRRAAFAVVVAGLALVACRVEGKKSQFSPLGADAAALRAAFNADGGRVRLVVLVSPS
jgi:hypothetical protein